MSKSNKPLKMRFCDWLNNKLAKIGKFSSETYWCDECGAGMKATSFKNSLGTYRKFVCPNNECGRVIHDKVQEISRETFDRAWNR